MCGRVGLVGRRAPPPKSTGLGGGGQQPKAHRAGLQYAKNANKDTTTIGEYIKLMNALEYQQHLLILLIKSNNSLNIVTYFGYLKTRPPLGEGGPPPSTPWAPWGSQKIHPKLVRLYKFPRYFFRIYILLCSMTYINEQMWTYTISFVLYIYIYIFYVIYYHICI